ncbi:hypothetical protein CAP48_17890 [Advenella sp. S44]|nr:hypothetical protein CAP48_17890 [Advenella sp. S44]
MFLRQRVACLIEINLFFIAGTYNMAPLVAQPLSKRSRVQNRVGMASIYISEVGSLNKFIQITAHDNYAAIEALKQRLAANAEWCVSQSCGRSCCFPNHENSPTNTNVIRAFAKR